MKRIKKIGVITTILIVNILIVSLAEFNIKGNLTLSMDVTANHADTYQVFYSKEESWKEEESVSIDYTSVDNVQTLTYLLPEDITNIRIDTGNEKGNIILSSIQLNYLWKRIDIGQTIIDSNKEPHDIKQIYMKDNAIFLEAEGSDPFVVLSVKNIPIKDMLMVDETMRIIFKVGLCIGINILIFILLKRRKIILELIKEILNSKNLIWNLAKNDFKTKYAGSYLGIIWAFVQPVVTVLVYWFVFQVGFKSAPIENFPFILWLVAGLVPWFFFSEALLNATNSMIEYSYLVKKVVFKISILPIVKIISSLFVHLFFVGFAIFLFALYGYAPTIYTLQVIYYTVCMFILVLGMVYATSAIVIFFKDLGQIINIFLQIGMWMTPIMWSYNMIPDKYQWILKINPMYYIVEGYRDSLINKVWFWERINQTIYFWVVAIGLIGVGSLIFKKLKVHFADVL